MNTERFIAKKIVSRSKANFSRPIVRIAIAGIALGITVMFVAVAILTGFQQQIREKVIGFGAHIQITRFDENASYEPQPISIHQDFLPVLRSNNDIRHIQAVASKAGIIKTADQIQGVVLKGIGRDFDHSFFNDKLTEGRMIRLPDSGKSNEVLVSRHLAKLLNLRLDGDLRMYFISGNTTLGRKFTISGIYETGMEEFDKLYVIGDIRHIQKLNGWDSTQIGGFEVFLRDFNTLDRMGTYIYKQVGYSMDAKTIRQLYPQIFDWLDLQDINVLIILILMVMVSAITMISTLLILILERTTMIGILKSLGMRNSGIRRIFLFNAVYIIGIGLLWGNAVSLLLCLLQQKFGFIRLPQESYYVSVVPINLNLLNILVLNIGTLLVCSLALILPSFIVSRISPIRAIRYD